MPTKKILLRGISRTPSDRMSADGGLAESIGFENDMQELAVNVPATDVTRDIVGNDVSLDNANLEDVEVVYIHKTNDYTNYIAKNNTGIGLLDSVSPYFHAFYTFESGETFKEIKSVGNTLIVLIADTEGKTKRVEYILFKDNEYVPLGDELPEPKITIKPIKKPDETTEVRGHTVVTFAYKRNVEYEYSEPNDGQSGNGFYALHLKITEDEWVALSETSPTKMAYATIRNGIRAKITENVRFNLRYDLLSFPVLLRYALRLYDGSYARHSAPIFIDPKYQREKNPLDHLNYHFESDSDTRSTRTLSEDGFLEPYYLEITYDREINDELDKWSDIIQSVDLFATPDLEQFVLDMDWVNGLYYTRNHGELEPHYPDDDDHTLSIFNLKTLTDEKRLENILKSSNFYLLKAFDWKELANNLTGELELTDYDVLFGPDLVTKKMLTDDNGTNNKLLPNHLIVYNERLIAVGASIKLYNGPYFLPSISPVQNNYGCRVLYRIRTSAGTVNVLKKHPDYMPGPFLFYPDVRCYEAVIYSYENHMTPTLKYGIKTVTVPLIEHPYLNGSYFFKGYEQGTQQDCYDGDWYSYYDHGGDLYDTIEELWAAVDNIAGVEEDKSNILYQTDTFNLFLFPIQQSFIGSLVDVAVVTKALSTGQFGYSTLYAFTDNGLWSLQTNADGSLGKVDVISQDVALPGTVCQLDQAVVFTTKKGVMLLTGSDLRCISDKMHGRHYKLDAAVHSLLAGVGSEFKQDWGDLADMAYEDLPFMDYMQEARTAYDYVGRRLLFFSVADNPQPYIYTYMIETDSWHKVVMPERHVFKRVLNSYPDTYIAMDRIVSPEIEHVPSATRYARMFSFSNARSQSDTTRYKGLIVTRPMDLDEDDVRKVMNRLFIRGSYPKTFLKSAQVEDRPVKMVLMGSADGQTWQMLRSFRGGSYKLFRLVLLCQLTQAERISYVEAEYESRYTNRLR